MRTMNHKPLGTAERVEVDAEYIRELRRECRTLRLQVKEVKTEAERVRHAIERRLILAETTVAAIRAGLIDPDAAVLIDLTRVSINDSGDLVGIEDAVQSLRDGKPHFFSTAQGASRGHIQ